MTASLKDTSQGFSKPRVSDRRCDSDNFADALLQTGATLHIDPYFLIQLAVPAVTAAPAFVVVHRRLAVLRNSTLPSNHLDPHSTRMLANRDSHIAGSR
jgi:hypothetical protein